MTGAFIYERSTVNPVGGISVLISVLFSLLFSMIGGLIYSVLTITFRANQNVVGLALTTFGIGFGNFVGGQLSRFAGTTGQISVKGAGAAFKHTVSGLSEIPVVGTLFFSYGFLTYLALFLAIALALVLRKTSVGLKLRAVGENPGTVDAAGISVSKYRYVATIVGAMISGLGGLYFWAFG